MSHDNYLETGSLLHGASLLVSPSDSVLGLCRAPFEWCYFGRPSFRAIDLLASRALSHGPLPP
jgi:hypothetical protein